MTCSTRDQSSLFGYISPVTGEVSAHPPLCACGSCSMPVEPFCPNLDTEKDPGKPPAV